MAAEEHIVDGQQEDHDRGAANDEAIDCSCGVQGFVVAAQHGVECAADEGAQKDGQQGDENRGSQSAEDEHEAFDAEQ